MQNTVVLQLEESQFDRALAKAFARILKGSVSGNRGTLWVMIVGWCRHNLLSMSFVWISGQLSREQDPVFFGTSPSDPTKSH